MSTPEEKTPTAAFLHMSDMHLGASFQDAGGLHRKALRAAIEVGAFQMQSHHTQILLTLPLEIQRIWRLTEAELVSQSGGKYESQGFFDAVIVSGDISTDATNEERFEFAFQYLTSEVKALERGMYSEQSWVGLSIPPKALLCVPGNHDKMRETGLVRYYVGFEQAPGPLNYVTFVRRNGAALVFFGIDSNEYTEGNVAMGEIDPARLAWLTRTLVNAEKKGLKVDDDFLTPDEFQQSTRCLILHHHPVDLKKGLKGLSGLLTKKFTVLRGADKLLNLIKGRVDVIFHGHEHFPICFRHRETGVIIVSAGTVSEWTARPFQNSFYIVTLFSDYTLAVQEYLWTGSKFQSREKLTGQKPQTFPLIHRMRQSA